MSRSTYVKYRDRGFWVYDVALGVFLKYLIDASVLRTSNPENSWLSEAIPHWRLYACLSDFGFAINDEWSAAQIDTLADLCEEACSKLAERPSISADEIREWPIHDDLRIDPRDETQVPTAPVIRLGQAIARLAKGTLDHPLPGFYLVYDLGDQPRIVPSG